MPKYRVHVGWKAKAGSKTEGEGDEAKTVPAFEREGTRMWEGDAKAPWEAQRKAASEVKDYTVSALKGNEDVEPHVATLEVEVAAGDVESLDAPATEAPAPVTDTAPVADPAE